MPLLGWFRRASGAAEGEIRELTAQFHVTLRANLARTHKVNGKLDQKALDRLAELLSPTRPQSWAEAYEAEQILVDVYDDETLKTECAVRGIEARKALSPQLAEFYAKEMENPRSSQERQGLLARLINDLQWRYTVNDVKRRYSTDITSRTGWLFTIALLASVSVIGYIVFAKVEVGDLELLLVSALAGTWGATFSMLASLKARLGTSELDDMKLMKPIVMLFSRALIGTGAGCVLYFLLRSGLLGGAAFPELSKLGSQAFDQRNLAMLVIWCFIAGFSEKLVPSILERTEARAGAAIGSTEPERFRPGPGVTTSRSDPATPPKGENAKSDGDTGDKATERPASAH